MITREKDSWKRWNVAITGINSRVESPGPGCAVARCLKECTKFGGRVIGLGYDVLDAGLYARDLCDAGYLIPYPSTGQSALLERLLDIHAQEQIDAIIPCLDAELPTLIGLRNDLARLGIRMLLPSRDQFSLRAKDHLGPFCQSAGVLAPECKTVTDPAFFDNCEHDGWQYPLMIKGLFYDASQANSSTEARAIFFRLVNSWGYPVLVQKVIKGDEFNVTGIGDGKGNLLGTVMMRKKALTEKGKAWSGVTVMDDQIGQVAERLVSALSWRGPLEVEVMKSEDGKIYLIEINPRFPAWIYLSHAVGRNLPVTLLKVLNGESEFELAAPRSGTFFIRYAQELILELPQFEAMLVGGCLSPTRPALPRTLSA